MNESVSTMMTTLSHRGIVLEYLVTNPSIEPAITKKGRMLTKILALSLAPATNECFRE